MINRLFGDILWEVTHGLVYRCKGLFLAVNDSPTVAVDDLDCLVASQNGETQRLGIFAVQGVGGNFEIERAYPLQQTAFLSHTHDTPFQSKFLFVGRGLKRQHLFDAIVDCRSE
eukprot:Selendium_serpulae@DN2400_c0_g1_i1.p1